MTGTTAAARRHLRIVTLCGSIRPLFSGTDDYDAALTARLRARGVEVLPVDLGAWGVGLVGRLLREVAARRPDVILMQYPTDAFGRRLGPQCFALLQRTAPLVVTLHEFTAAHVLRRAAILPLALRAATLVTTAEKEASALRRWFPWLRRRMEIIPIGANVPPRRWQPAPLREVVTFGQIRPEKGLEQFLQCRQRLAAAFPDVQFTIIGSKVPLFAGYFDTMAEQAKAAGVTLVTGLDSEAVSDRLAAATLALLPYPDGTSMRRGSMLAASVCGTPIVTLMGDDTPPSLAAMLDQARSIDDMVALATRYLSDPAALQAAHAQSVRLGALVGWDTIADRYVAILGRVAGTAPDPVDAPALAGASAGRSA